MEADVKNKKLDKKLRFVTHVLGAGAALCGLFAAVTSIVVTHHFNKHENDPVLITKTPVTNNYRLVDNRHMGRSDTLLFTVAENGMDTLDAINSGGLLGKMDKNGVVLTKFHQNTVTGASEFPVTFEATNYILGQ